MLPISTDLIEILKHDYLPYRAPVTKQLVLYFADLNLTITDDDFPDGDSFSLEDSLCGDELTFGDCVSACMKFQVEGITQDLVGQKFTAKFVIYSTDIKLGTFIVSEAPQEDDDNVKAVVAYDLMSKFDVDVTEWYNDIDFDAGVKLKELRESLCIYCGVPYENSNLPNDNMVVKRTISTNKMIGRDVLKSCEELNGCFGHMNRDGKLKHIVLAKSNPVDTIDNTAYESLVLEEYTTDPISKVQIRQEDGDVGAYSGTGDNCYTITGNFLVYGKSASELATIADNAATNILGITYRPYESIGQGLPYQDMGDYVTFSGKETVNSYILQSTLTGTQILDGKISAKGSKTLTEDTGLNLQIIQLKAQTNVLKRTVEETTSTISEINNTVGEINENITELKQTSTEMSSSISSIQTTVNKIPETYTTKTEFSNLQIGGRNLYLYTKEYNCKKYTGWVDANAGSRVIVSEPYTTYNGFGVQRIARAWVDTSQRITLETNTIYILSAWIKSESADAPAKLQPYVNSGSSVSKYNFTDNANLSDIWTRYYIVFNSGTLDYNTCRFESSNINPYLIYGLKLEKGTKATDWTPAPEDIEASLAAETDRSTKVETTLSNQIKQTADSLTSEISSRKVTEFEIKGLLCSENLICSEDLVCFDGLIDIKTEEVRTEVKQTINSYGVQIDNLSANMSAQFLMLEASIALKVSKHNLIGEINLSAEEAKINFNKITLEGYTTINNYFKVLLDGSIEATNAKFSGKISASTITGTEISGTNITGGTINGATITSSGTGNTTKIQSGYIETTRITLNVGSSYANSLLTNAGLTVNYSSSYANYSTEISITNGTYSTYISATNGTIAGSQILTASNYTNSGRTFPPSSHGHLSTDITPLTTGPGNIDFAGAVNGASVTWVQDNFQTKSSSDMRLKRDIKSLDNIVDFYMGLKPKSYKFKGDLDDGLSHYGLLAQEVLSNGVNNGIDVTGIVQAYDTREYLDEGIYTGDKAYRVNYEELHGLHISMIQNMEKRLRELEDRTA